ncbi:MAG: hypothetical protein AAFS12_04710 [Cyanobacteria bacterium J06632_19]
MKNINIYDDPNVLIGDSSVENLPAYAITRLRKINSIIPPWEDPPKKGFELLKIWDKSNEGQNWNKGWDYLISLSIDKYLYLFSEFPQPFISNGNEKQKVVIERIKNYYKVVGTWMLWLAHTDRAKPKILNHESYKNFELDAQIHMARLRICQQIIDDSKFKAKNWFNRNPASLWFWLEIANCKGLLENKGLVSPISHNNIYSKSTIHTEVGKQLDYLDGLLPSTDFIEINGLQAYLKYLPQIVDTVAFEISELNDEFEVGFFKPYIKLRRKLRNKLVRDKSRQISYLHLQSNNTELFITGDKKKIPKK